MKTSAVRQAVLHWLASQGYAGARASNRADSLRTWGSDAEWYVVLRGDMNKAFDYVRAFDEAMDAVISTDQAVTDLPRKLAVAVAFSSTLRGGAHSYGKAIKKYTNSAVFTDLAIHLLLVKDDLSVEVVLPEEVPPFLRDLNRYIIASK